MLVSTFQKVGDRTAMSLWQRLVSQIERNAQQLEPLAQDQLRKQSLSLKYRARSGEPLKDLLVEAYSLVREAARRTLGMQHYPVQLLGGIAIHFGSVAVMQTGEGKTLTATLPIYLAAIQGKGAHLATANDYLAARDAELMTPIYNALGLSVGIVMADTIRPQRQQAYHCDVTYSTAKEIGFDFLRDRLLGRRVEQGQSEMVRSLVDDGADDGSAKPVQRGLNFVLVDEADSILIDEARTPLIVSSQPDEIALAQEALYRWTSEVCGDFEIDVHYEVDPQSNQVSLKPDGRRLSRKLPHPELLNQTPSLDIYDQLEQAIFVDRNYICGRQYVVRDDEVVIVDEFTGRLAEGRKWRSGLHQAIEAREGLKISIETGEAARITLQDLFLRYDRLAGMTGTAANSALELRKIYKTRVLAIPTNRPPRRERWSDQVFGTEDQKWEAIADEISTVSQAGRPVLVGTRSIDKSERLSDILTQRKITHDVLNARHLAREADIVAGAGQVGKVTVATNMAGRGTDIKPSSESLALGGLHVICSELHESARIDRQLIGRCGRQGDPGTFRQFMSLEDELLETGLSAKTVQRLAGYKSHSADAVTRFAPLFRKAQAKTEREHFAARKMLLHREQQRQEMQREMGQDPYLDTAGA